MQLFSKLGCLLLVGITPALVAQHAGKPVQIVPTTAAPTTAAPSPQAAQGGVRPGMRPESAARIWFIEPKTPVAAKFRSGYFGMPYVLSPWTGEGDELHLLQPHTHLVFKKEGLGWRFASTIPLPPPPGAAQIRLSGEAEKELSEFDRDQALRAAQKEERNTEVYGYQVDDKGTVYWTGRNAMFRWVEGGWQLLWVFPKELMDRRPEGVSFGHVVVLPKNRLALIGTTDAFLKVLEFPDTAPPMATPGDSGAGALPRPNPNPQTAGEPKSLRSIGYDSIGACEKTMINIRNVQFFATGDHLFFYLGNIGRFFRLRLDSFSLTELDTPWIARMAGERPDMEEGWRPSRDNALINPVLPKAVAFAPRPDGTVHGRALMWNMDPAVIHSFELGSEGSSIKREIHMEAEMPEPIVLPDPQGDLIPIGKLIGPDPTLQSSPTPQKGSAPQPDKTRPVTRPKEN